MPERNPYLILGVDFAASGDRARHAFARAARRVRKHGGPWEIEDLNWALHEVEALESSPADLVDVYRVPADPKVFDPAGEGLFRPPPVPLDRRTTPNDEAAVAAVRVAASASSISCWHPPSRPWRLTRSHRMSSGCIPMRGKELADRLASIHGLVDKLDRSVERIEIVTVVREPNSALSADAYNGLRKQVIAAAGERNAHLYQLAQFDSALRAGATPEELATLVREWMGQASLEVVDDPGLEDGFQFVGPENATGRKVVSPAYVDRVTRRIVRAGVAERVPEARANPEPAPEPPAAATDDGAVAASEPESPDEPAADGSLSAPEGEQ